MSAGESVDGHVTLDPGPVDVEALVTMVLEDEQLRAAAAGAGLHRDHIVKAVRAQSVDWEHAGQVDTRGRLDEARRLEQAIREHLAHTSRRPWWLWLYYTFLCAIAGLVVVGGIGAKEAPLIVAVAVAIVLSPFVGIAVGIEGVRSRRRSRLEMAAHDTANETAAARDELWRELAEALVKPLIRYELNAREESRYDTKIGAVESEGLAEILNPKYLISTDAARRLDRFMKDMPGGSIGLSGPRGAGKSSLIQAECPSGDNQPEGLLGIVVAAPVQFEPRDFILHLFSELCMAVLGRDAVERLRNPSPLPRATTSLAWAFAGSVVVALLGAAIVVNELLDRPSDIALGIAVTAVGVTSAAVLATLRMRARRTPARRLGRLWDRVEVTAQRFSSDIEFTAARQLRAIWFQQTFSEGWSGTLKLPGGLQGGVEGGRELARQQMSLPDIVSELRRLIAAVTDDGEVRVRIGIDELDKIDSPEDAARFFNEIKVLFGIVDCFFLVSVSEDALASFERRGMPVRDVFDSSFDDVIRLEHLAAHNSLAMLNERIVGMPTPFMLLCHCLSGGLPRDLIRTARDLVSLLPEEEPADADATLRLSDACAALIAAQLDAKAGGVTTAARRDLPPHAAVTIRDFADQLASGAPTADRLRAYVQAASNAGGAMQQLGLFPSDTRAVMASFAAELTTFAYFCATLLELFDEELPESHFASHIHQDDATLRNGGRSVVDQLAHARQAFAVHPRAAWSAIAHARRAAGYDLLADYPFERALSDVAGK